MPINNPGLYDAVLAAIAASNEAMLIDPTDADYLVPANIAVAVAVEIDSQIAADAAISISKRILLEGITKSVFAGRCPQSLTSSDYLATARAIAAMYREFVTKLQDSGGGGSTLNLTKVLYVDKNTTCPIGTQNGNIESPFNTLTAALAVATDGTMIYVMPYDYRPEVSFNIDHNVAIATNVFVEQEDVSGVVPFALYGDFNVAAGKTLQLVGASVNNVIGTTTSVVMLNQCNALSVLGYSTVELETTTIDSLGTVQATTLKATKATLPVSINFALSVLPAASICQIRHSQLASTTITFDVTATNGLVQIDNDSLHAPGYVGLVDVVNGTTKIIDDNLMNGVLFVDIGNAESAASQDGSITNPFSSLTRAVTTASAGDTIFVTPGTYTGEANINITKSLTLIGFGGFAAIPGLNVSGAVALNTDNIGCTPGLGSGILNIAATGAVVAKNGTFVNAITGDGSLSIDNCTTVNAVTAAFFAAINSTVLGNVTLSGTTCVLYNTSINGGGIVVTFSGSPGTVSIDGVTYSRWHRSGSSVVNPDLVTDGIDIINATAKLSNVYYVDGGTKVQAPARDGTIANPYATLEEARLAIEAGKSPEACILMTPGTYAATTTDLPTLPISVQNIAGQDTANPCSLILPALNASQALLLEGIKSSGPIFTIDKLTVIGCSFDVAPEFAGPLTSGDTLLAKDSRVPECISATDGIFDTVTFTDSVTAYSVITMTDCDFENGITVTFTNVTPGTLYLDAITYSRWIAASCIIVNGTIAVSGSLVNLSNTLWVDKGTAIASVSQNGNIESPFANLTDALVAVPAGGLLKVTSGDYSLEGDLYVTQSIGLNGLAQAPIASGANPCILAVIFLTAGKTLSLANVFISNITVPATSSLLATNDYIGSIIGDGYLELRECILPGNIVCHNLIAYNCAINSGINPVTISGTDCSLRQCTFASACAITFSGSAGIVTMDAITYQAFLASGSTVVNGTITVLNAFKTLEADLDGDGHAIWNFRNGGSNVNLAVAGGATVSFPAYVIPDLSHAVKTYCATFGFRCGMYRDALHTDNGEMDFQIGMSIVTDAGGVATCTLDTVPVPNVSYLPAALAGATFAVTPSAGGFTVSVTAPAGSPANDCHAWYDFWLQKYRDIT